MSNPYTADHQWVGATHVPLNPTQAKQGARRGTVRVAETTKVDILDVYCAQCRRPYDAVNGRPCEASENRDHLIGGPTGERAKRTHPYHDCEKYGCTLPRPDPGTVVVPRRVG